MTTLRHTREPLRQCAAEGCPFLTRHPAQRCPLHTKGSAS